MSEYVQVIGCTAKEVDIVTKVNAISFLECRRDCKVHDCAKECDSIMCKKPCEGHCNCIYLRIGI